MVKKKKHKRLIFIIISLLLFSAAALLSLKALEDTATLYITPKDINFEIPPKKPFRLGGIVEQGSLHFLDDEETVEFSITDKENRIVVRYKGIIPNLFKEGQAAVVKGKLNTSNIFVADEILAKHDENYMPPEVAKSLEKP